MVNKDKVRARIALSNKLKEERTKNEMSVNFDSLIREIKIEFIIEPEDEIDVMEVDFLFDESSIDGSVYGRFESYCLDRGNSILELFGYEGYESGMGCGVIGVSGEKN